MTRYSISSTGQRSQSTRLRRHISVVTATCVALTLAACGSSGSDSANDGTVELTFTWWGADARAQLTEQVINKFEDQNPGITIKGDWGGWEGYWDKLAISTAGGDAPDVIQMDETRIAAYGEREALLDLTTQPEILDLSEMESAVLQTGEVKDILAGVPVGVGIFSVGVNPEILKQAGLQVPDDTTWTWEEMFDMAAQVSETLGGQGIYGFDFFGTQTAELGAFARQQGEEVFPREDETPVSAQTLENYFETALQLMETGATPSASAQAESTGTLEDSLFGTNKSAFHLQFHTQIQAFVDASGSDLLLLRLPAQKEGEPANMVNKASMYWSISSRTEHPEEAAKFVDFLVNDEDAAAILKVERGVPAIPAIQEFLKPQLTPTGTMSLEFAADMQEQVIKPPQVTPANASDFSTEFTRIGNEVLFGSQTPAQGAEAVLAILSNLR
ncbi:multiple sugar transport system substrate-binding protein [Arthrobacter sp. UYP6]|uniref:ABC transporter substrate-binding protein n=1 Tax=Arthrobacter sp. UYP6 TaxID=1756378 RepID=UPI003398666C